ncbi:SRPBCC family protein [Flavobacteriaceae bacterium S0825]|uniref:SRPBCC family protein n=1 Tax=Gaetbulibacter sp. S0825 TaxID=2720084 RepID=UPI00143143CA|nr:SRPBCC family protein [Gaetbulibacter sp. S0825]MCK0109680.1 SRPBCC family protein [Flavobacteriaceae bacterium S0825]NIX65313.1 SRPBCC family protein [Gaetbulibacter sp. S0825]
MSLIEIKTLINADIKTCFDSARNIDFHKESLQHSNEKAIAGKTSGLIDLGEWVTWEARHFGVKQKLTSKITKFNSPTYFVDEQVSGAFKYFKHEHIFEIHDEQTLMIDRFDFESPFGIFGRLINVLFLKKYMTNLLAIRNQFLKQKAEEINCHTS